MTKKNNIIPRLTQDLLETNKHIKNEDTPLSKIENNSEQLQKIIVTALEDVKGIDITVIPVAKLTSLTDYMIICSGTSDRHVKALANSVHIAVKNVQDYIKSEGEETGEWILLDASDVVVHVMQSKAREYYNLEQLWRVDAD